MLDDIFYVHERTSPSLDNDAIDVILSCSHQQIGLMFRLLSPAGRPEAAAGPGRGAWDLQSGGSGRSRRDGEERGCGRLLVLRGGTISFTFPVSGRHRWVVVRCLSMVLRYYGIIMVLLWFEQQVTFMSTYLAAEVI